MVEPKIAATILSVSLSHDSGLVVDILPKDLVSFVSELAKGDFDSLVPLDSAEEPDEGLVDRYKALLHRYNLTSRDYVGEALRQAKIGGLKPSRFVEDVARFASCQTISSEVQQIKQQEAKESDLSARLKLAQDKLLKKRTLTKLGRQD